MSKRFMFNAVYLLPLALALGCVSRGSNVKKLGDDIYEARAWDGYGCLKTSDNNTCFTLLMPIIKSKAEESCDGSVKSITPCLRYEATTADRIVCRVNCQTDDEDGDEYEQEAEQRKRPIQKNKKDK